MSDFWGDDSYSDSPSTWGTQQFSGPTGQVGVPPGIVPGTGYTGSQAPKSRIEGWMLGRRSGGSRSHQSTGMGASAGVHQAEPVHPVGDAAGQVVPPAPGGLQPPCTIAVWTDTNTSKAQVQINNSTKAISPPASARPGGGGTPPTYFTFSPCPMDAEALAAWVAVIRGNGIVVNVQAATLVSVVSPLFGAAPSRTVTLLAQHAATGTPALSARAATFARAGGLA